MNEDEEYDVSEGQSEFAGAVEGMSREVLIEELRAAYARSEELEGYLLGFAEQFHDLHHDMQTRNPRKALQIYRNLRKSLALTSEEIYGVLGYQVQRFDPYALARAIFGV